MVRKPLIIIIVSICFFLLVSNQIEARSESNQPSTPPIRVDNTDYPVLYVGEPCLEGEAVWMVQARLRDLGYEIVPNGRYDLKTSEVVRLFQLAHHLKTNGVVSKSEWECLMYDEPDTSCLTEATKNQPKVMIEIDIGKHNLKVFHDREFVDDVSDKMSKTRFRSYPVLDEHKRVIGAVSRFHLFNYEKKKLILLDHNERSQSINDLEMAEVLEIIDHHRIGDIETSNPINFRNQQIGSTCSIIATMYKEQGIEPTPTIAGLLCCAIISDTMNFNSPTSTALDRSIADDLAQLAGIDTDALAKEMYESVATLRFKSFGEILYNDFKEFSIEGTRLGIGQINLLDIRELEIIKKEFVNYMEKINNANQYDLLMMVFTNAEGKGSNLVFVGSKGWIIDQAFKDAQKEKMYFVENVVSRKKQLIPAISKVLKEVSL